MARKGYRDTTLNRCIKCTLPLGSCAHKNDWEDTLKTMAADKTASRKVHEAVARMFREEEEERKQYKSPIKDSVSNEMDELTDILKGGVAIETHAQVDDVDISRLRWYRFEPRLSDKIGDQYFSLSTPPPRGWHSLVHIGRFLLLFGGFCYRGSEVPQPFQGATKHDEVEYLNDLYLYDRDNLSWYDPPPLSRRKYVCAYVYLATVD